MTVSIVSYIALFVDRKFVIVTLPLPPPPPPLLRNFLNQINTTRKPQVVTTTFQYSNPLTTTASVNSFMKQDYSRTQERYSDA
jgi:hypothetical protein